MKYERKALFLKLLLILANFILWIMWASLAAKIVVTNLFTDSRTLDSEILKLLTQIIYIISYTFIISSLKKILNKILENKPFDNDNIKPFKTIGYSILTIGIVEAIVTYPEFRHIEGIVSLRIIQTPSGSLNPIVFLYIILSILAFILADIFEMAINIKDENDLTI